MIKNVKAKNRLPSSVTLALIKENIKTCFKMWSFAIPLLKENCNAKTSWFHMKEHSKCWRTVCISLGIGQAVLQLLSLKIGSEYHLAGIFLVQKSSVVSPKMTTHLTSHNFQISKIGIFSEPFLGDLGENSLRQRSGLSVSLSRQLKQET